MTSKKAIKVKLIGCKFGWKKQTSFIVQKYIFPLFCHATTTTIVLITLKTTAKEETKSLKQYWHSEGSNSLENKMWKASEKDT